MYLKEKTSKRYADYIPYAGLIGNQDNAIAVTKNGIIIRTFFIEVKNLAYASDYEINETFKALKHSIKFISDGKWLLYIDAFRTKTKAKTTLSIRNNAPAAAKAFNHYHNKSIGDFFLTDHYLTIAYNPYSERNLKNMFFKQEKNEKNDNFAKALDDFINTTDDMYNTLKNVFASINIIDNKHAMTFFHRCVSPYYHDVLPPEIPFYLDYYLGDAKFIPDSVTKLDDYYIKTISIHDFPSQTRSDMITSLMATDEDFHLSVRFSFLPKEEARKKIKSYRRSHFQKRKGVGALLAETITHEESLLEDSEAISYATDSSEALASLASGDMSFGHVTTTVIIISQDWQVAKTKALKIKKIINEKGYIAKEETLNNPLAFLGTFHGNIKYNSRSPLISTLNLLHLFPLSMPWEGNRKNKHLGDICGTDSPHMITRAGKSPFWLNLNVGDVGHTLVVGPTGGGKSILLNTLALQFLRYPRSRIIFFDKDRSSKWACKNAKGVFLDIGSDDCDFLFNPFAKIANLNYRRWFTEYLIIFLKSKGVTLSSKDENEILKALNTMQHQKIEVNNFESLIDAIQSETTRAALRPFSEGDYSRLFAPVSDNITDSYWTTFEMATLMEMGDDIVRFTLGYIFHQLTTLFKGDPTLLVLDEAWLFLDNEFFAQILREWLKTLRKKNCYVVLATQELADVQSTIFSTIVNACMTKIYLPNNQAAQSENRRLYLDLGLNDSDIETLINAEAKRDYLYHSPKGKQLFDMCLDARQLTILKSNLNQKIIKSNGE